MTSLVFWSIIGVVTFIVDIFTSSFLFVWFSVGAIVAIIASCLNVSFIFQVILFLIVSITSVSIGYPWIRKKYKNSEHRIPLMEENYIGKIILSEKDINEKSTIKVGGIYWTVINYGDPIKSGDKFKIIGIEGTKLKIKKI